MTTFDSAGRNKGKIRKVVHGSKLITPIIINVDNRSLTGEELVDYECSWHKTQSDPSTCIVTFSNHEKDNYQGTTQLQSGLSKTLLVVQNKESNKVQLIEVNRCNLARVFEKPSLPSNSENDQDESYQENQSRILRAFGSKKGKRASQIGSGMKINSEIMSSQMKETAADVSVDLKELELADTLIDSSMPPIRRDAVTSEGVYVLEDFLTQRELESIEDEVFTVFHLIPFTEEESGLSQFFIDCISRLHSRLNIERIKALLYLDILMKFVNTPDRKLQKKDLHERICPFSPLIAKKILDNFTVQTFGGRVRSATMEDKLVAHIIALLIIGCDSCNIEELSRNIPRFSIKKMGLIMRNLCLTSRDKATWSVKLPLPPQRSSFMRKRK